MNIATRAAATQMVVEKTEKLFPWLDALGTGEVQDFYSDLFDAIQHALHSGDWSGVQVTIEEWQATAEVASDPPLAAMLRQPLETGEWEDWEEVRAGIHHQD